MNKHLQERTPVSQWVILTLKFFRLDLKPHLHAWNNYCKHTFVLYKIVSQFWFQITPRTDYKPKQTFLCTLIRGGLNKNGKFTVIIHYTSIFLKEEQLSGALASPDCEKVIGTHFIDLSAISNPGDKVTSFLSSLKQIKLLNKCVLEEIMNLCTTLVKQIDFPFPFRHCGLSIVKSNSTGSVKSKWIAPRCL